MLQEHSNAEAMQYAFLVANAAVSGPRSPCGAEDLLLLKAFGMSTRMKRVKLQKTNYIKPQRPQRPQREEEKANSIKQEAGFTS